MGVKIHSSGLKSTDFDYTPDKGNVSMKGVNTLSIHSKGKNSFNSQFFNIKINDTPGPGQYDIVSKDRSKVLSTSKSNQGFSFRGSPKVSL